MKKVRHICLFDDKLSYLLIITLRCILKNLIYIYYIIKKSIILHTTSRLCKQQPFIIFTTVKCNEILK